MASHGSSYSKLGWNLVGNCSQCGRRVTSHNGDKWMGKNWCVNCGRKYRRDYNRVWQSTHRENVRRTRRKMYLAAKLRAVESLGGRCNCSLNGCWHEGQCRITDHRILQIDHIHGGGKREVVASVSSGTARQRYYLRVVKSVQSGENKYQLLCANCNWMKRMLLRL